MAFTNDELSDIVDDIRNDLNYFSKSDSIIDRCTFSLIDDKLLCDTAVDSITERELQFSIFGRVIRKSTFLQPEGFFRPSGISPPNREEISAFQRSRLKAALAPPKDILDARTAKDEWARYQTTMQRLIKSAIPSTEGTKHWSPYRKDKNVFLMSHLLISNKDDISEDDKKTQGTTVEANLGEKSVTLSPSGEVDNDPIEEARGVGLPSQRTNLEQHIDQLMSIKEWPASGEWHAVADKFDKTHHTNPLPAFDDGYELIMPRAYEARLLGAVVHARFTLSRFNIKGLYVFVCNIVELQVLKPPVGGAEHRKKRVLVDLVQGKKQKRRRLA